MKTCPCNVYPLEPHFHIAKLRFAGVYLFFLFLLQNTDCEPPRRGGSNAYPQSRSDRKQMKWLAKSSPFNLLFNPCVINRFIFGQRIVIYYILCEAFLFDRSRNGSHYK